jgi:hypothetical protein
MSVIKVYRTDKSSPNIPVGTPTIIHADVRELHMIDSKKEDPSLVFVTLNRVDSQYLQVVMKISISALNKALAELGYTLYQP